MIPARSMHAYGWGLVVLAWLACVVWIAARLPVDAIVTGDTSSYLTLASHRPPVYGWFLNAYRWINGGFAYLPFVQLGLFASGLLIFAAELGLLLGSPLAAAVAMILVAMHAGIHHAPAFMMSESVFGLFLLAGLGLQFRAVRQDSVVSLAGAAACFALAAGTRTSGAVFLLIPLLSACLDRRRGLAAAAARAGKVALVAGVILLLVMAGNWVRNDRFEIGSWSGMSLLGKGLLLLEPSDVAGLPPPAASLATAAKSLRATIEGQHDFGARLRAQDQAFQDLRYALFFPKAEQRWPAWTESDWRERGQLALALSETVIEHHPWQYLELWANDWLSLVLYPQLWPDWATAQANGALFPACRLQDNCWVLRREDVHARTLLGMFAVSLAGTVGGALLLVVCARRVLTRQAGPATALFWTLALVLQISLLATSAFEAGLVRYTSDAHVLGVALLLWFASLLPRRFAVASIGRWRPPARRANAEDHFSKAMKPGAFVTAAGVPHCQHAPSAHPGTFRRSRFPGRAT